MKITILDKTFDVPDDSKAEETLMQIGYDLTCALVEHNLNVEDGNIIFGIDDKNNKTIKRIKA